MLASCSERSSPGRPGAIDPTSSACWWPSALRAVSDPIRLMIASSALAPSDTAKTTTISQPRSRLVIGGAIGRSPSCSGITTGLYKAGTWSPSNWSPPGANLEQTCSQSGASGAGRGDDRVGHEAEHQPQQDSPGDQLLHPGGTRNGQELDHDVQDGARRQRQEGNTQQGRGDLHADDGAGEGGAAADKPEQREPRPGRPLTGRRQRCHNAKALGRVVRAEPDHQQQREAELAGRGGGPDGQP